MDETCLVVPTLGKQISGTMTVGPITATSVLTAKAIGKVAFDGGSYDTIEANLTGDFFHMKPTRVRVHVDGAMPLFPVGVSEFGHSGGTRIKYRRFAYVDAKTGQTVTPSLLGMKANETREYTINAQVKEALATDPQPAFAGVDDTTKMTIQYVGREDVVSNGSTYKHACKLAVTYNRNNTFFKEVQGTLWIAPTVGLVKLTGAPIMGVDTASVDLTGIVAAN